MNEPSPLLSLPVDGHDRWTLLDSLFTRWHKPSDRPAGFTPDDMDNAENSRGFSIPTALTEWYLHSGRRSEIWSRQDEFLHPANLYIENEALIFYVENQAVVKWGIPAAAIGLDDPPVVVESVNKADKWISQTDSISKFAIHMFTYALAFCGRHSWVYGLARPTLADAIRDNLPAFEFPATWWTGTQVFGYDDLIVAIDCTDHVHACATTDDSLATFLSPAAIDMFDVFASSDTRDGT